MIECSRQSKAIRLIGAIGVAVIVGSLPPAASSVEPAGTAALTAPESTVVFAEHRYRIVGKIRLALFWAGSDDVGSARLTWRSDRAGTSIALLAGSDPQHAPRRLNQWGYIREEVRSNDAEVFMLRSEGNDDDTPLGGTASALFNATCASIDTRTVRSLAARVSAADVTYRMVDRLLDQLAGAPVTWREKNMARPAGAEPGFLSALQLAIQMSAANADSRRTVAVSYFYNNAVYDLSVRGVKPLGRTIVGSRTFEHLTRNDFAIRNRATNSITKFAVTFVPDRSHVCLPVQIFYQPNFWVSVELRLDDDADVPADPGDDGSALTRIRQICAAAAR